MRGACSTRLGDGRLFPSTSQPGEQLSSALRRAKNTAMGKDLRLQRITPKQDDDLRLFLLEGLLPAGQALSVNTTHLIISLVSTAQVNGNPVLLERPVTENNMRLLLALLESPHCCPHEVLCASLLCSYQGLLAGIFWPDSAASQEWRGAVEESHRILWHAHMLGTWKKELKPLYKALSETRPKLHPFGLEIAISISSSAYALMPLPLVHQRLAFPRSARRALLGSAN